MSIVEMGLDDRNYMRDVPIYRDLVHGPPRVPPSVKRRSALSGGPPPPPPPPPPRPTVSNAPRRGATRPWAWFGAGVVVTLGLLTFATSRHHSGPPLMTAPPVAPAAPLPERIAGPDHALVGSVLTLQGSVAPQSDGPVVVEGRWDGGTWTELGTTQTVGGEYQLRIPLDQRGVIDLRMSLPGGQLATSTITVT